MIIASQKNHAKNHAKSGPSIRCCARVLVTGYLLGGALICAVAGPQEQYGQGRRDEAPARDSRYEVRNDVRNEQRPRGGDNQYSVRQAEPRQVDQRQTDPGRADPGRADPRSSEYRQRQQTQDQGHAEALKRSSRMTPDERRDLRRQINEAGQDIYATPPRR